MAVLFVANKVADIQGSSLVPATEGFDASLMNEAIKTVHRDANVNFKLSSEVPEVWHHFRIKQNSTTPSQYYSSEAYYLIDAGDRQVVRLVRGYNSYNLQLVVIGASTIEGVFHPINDDVTVDVHVKVDATNIEAHLFVGGVLLETITVGKGTRTGINRFTMSPSQFFLHCSDVTLSEMMLLTTSTLGLRLASLDVLSQGDLTGMVGDVMDLNTFGDGLGLVSNAANQRRSWNPSAYGGPARPIAAVVQSMVAERAGGSPSVLAAFLRKDGLNYDGPNKAIGSYTKTIQVWETNPMNGLPWDMDDLIGIQFGVKSGA